MMLEGLEEIVTISIAILFEKLKFWFKLTSNEIAVLVVCQQIKHRANILYSTFQLYGVHKHCWKTDLAKASCTS